MNMITSFTGVILIMLISTACSHQPIAERDKPLASEEAQKIEAPIKNETKTEKATPVKIKSAVFETLGFDSIEGEQKISDIVIDHDDQIIIKFVPDANANENLLSFSIQQDIANILLGIKKSNLIVKSVQLISNQSSTDQSGNTVPKEILNVTYLNETINKIDFESMNTDNMLSMADIVTYLDPALERK